MFDTVSQLATHRVLGSRSSLAHVKPFSCLSPALLLVCAHFHRLSSEGLTFPRQHRPHRCLCLQSSSQRVFCAVTRIIWSRPCHVAWRSRPLPSGPVLQPVFEPISLSCPQYFHAGCQSRHTPTPKHPAQVSKEFFIHVSVELCEALFIVLQSFLDTVKQSVFRVSTTDGSVLSVGVHCPRGSYSGKLRYLHWETAPPPEREINQ